MHAVPNRFMALPSTPLGRRAAGLGAAFVALFIVNVAVLSFVPDETFWRQFILPVYAPLMLLCGLAGGVAGALAIRRERERSLLAWLAVAMGLFVLLITLNEFMQLLSYLRGI